MGVIRSLNEYYEYDSIGDSNGISSIHILLYKLLMRRVKNPIFSF
jgi:hypothetical protein